MNVIQLCYIILLVFTEIILQYVTYKFWIYNTIITHSTNFLNALVLCVGKEFIVAL